MDRALLLLLLTAVVDVVVVARSHVSRSEKLGLGLFQIVLACVVVGAALTTLLGVDGGGRSLLACAAGPLVVLLVRGAPEGAGSATRLVRASGGWFAGLLVLGLGVEVLRVLRVGPAWLPVVPAAAVVVTAGLLVESCLRRLGPARGALARARVVDDAVAAGLLGLAGLAAAADVALRDLPLGGGVGGHLWAGLLACAAALTAATRVANAPPDRRDVAVVAVGAVLAVAVVDAGRVPLLACALGIAVVLGRTLLVPPRSTTSTPATLPPTTLPPGLGGVVPLLDDALLRRPARPRVLARTPARRLLDAALDRAQRAQPQHRGRPPIDVNASEGDADVDGDPSELAEALCAVIDNALRQQARHPWCKVSVVVRAAPQTVSFEVSDNAPEAAPEAGGAGDAVPFMGPFIGGRVDDVDRPGLGVSLARARLLVERHGGQLHARHGPEGSAVQLTLPRRLTRSSTGLA